MKRFLGIILSLAMLLSMCTVLLVTPASAATVISNTSPAILVNVGEKVILSSCQVVFDGTNYAQTWGITWKNSAGTTIESVTPTAKGVTKLTASYGSYTKTIYVVAKEQHETEYVLYEADMSSYNSLAEMKADGWTPCSADSYYDLSGDTLVINNYNEENPYGFVQMLLPSWLGDFGDYSFTAEAKILKVTDNGRWLSLSYRNSTKDGNSPYYQMCVRNDTTAGSGIEFSERTSSGWNVVTSTTGNLTNLTSDFHTFNVEAFGQNSRFRIDGEEVLCLTPDDYNSGTISPAKGSLGISIAGGNLSIKKVKVTIPLKLINNATGGNNLINPIANVEAINGAPSADNLAGNVMLTVSEISDVSAALKTCIDNDVLPTFYVTTNAEADKVLAAMTAYGCKDANAISPSASVLNYIRTSTSYIRTGLDLTSTLNQTTLTSKEADRIRVSVRSAPATFCVINIDSATTAVISELQELALAVWVEIDGTPGSDSFNIDVLKAITGGANGVISASASQVNELINTHLEENSMTRTPIIIGHRGNPTQAPENTISSFWAAYRNGADVFELDVEITSDGEIIIMHDSTINRTTNYTGTKTVNQMTLAEIKEYYILANDGSVSTEKVPTLQEVLEEFQDVDIRIFLEFKGSNSSNVPAVCSLLNEYDYGHKVDVISFSSTFLTQTQTNAPGMSTGYLTVPANPDGTTKENALYSLYDSILEAQKINSTINPACTIVKSEGNFYTQAVTDRGMTVWPWTYSGSWSNDVGFMSGCNGVTTDQVEWSKDMVKLMTASDYSLVVGGEYAGDVTIIEYDGDETVLKSHDTVISVISGSEHIEIVNGKLIGKSAGAATVIFGYKTETAYGSEYVVYSQPITITVTEGDKEALISLMERAESLTYDEYEEDVLAEIRSLYDQATALYASSDATDEQIANVCIKLAEYINNDDCVIRYPSLNVSYTTDTPDYTYSDANPDLFKDDGIRLTDGIKNSAEVTSAAYSAWKAASSPVDIVLDFGEITDTNIYNIYTCGDFWGISHAAGFTVSGSNDGSQFTEIGTTTEVVKLGAGDLVDGSTQTYLYRHTIKSESVQNYRYIKFTVNIKGNFLWIDEVEAIYSPAEPASTEGIYINGFNSLIKEGDAHIFTSDFNNGLITAATANHRYTQNIVAKWSNAYGGYIVQSVSTGNGTVSDIQLADDEILLAFHYSTYVPESMDNFTKSTKITVGQELVLYGLDIENAELGIAPYIRAEEPTTAEPEQSYIRGDVNDDGKITSTDYFILKRIIFGFTSVDKLDNPDTAGKRCDINGDNQYTASDYLMLKKAVYGLYEIPNN